MYIVKSLLGGYYGLTGAGCMLCNETSIRPQVIFFSDSTGCGQHLKCFYRDFFLQRLSKDLDLCDDAATMLSLLMSSSGYRQATSKMQPELC